MIIPLTNSSKVALVDEIDFENVIQYNWYVNYSDYVRSTIDGKTHLLHHVIALRMGLTIKKGVEIDHIDRDNYNMCRINLRVSNHAQNCANSAVRKNSSTGYKGVSVHKNLCKYKVQICVNGYVMSLGEFTDVIAAAKTYDKAAVKYFGEYAWLNFPEDYNRTNGV